MQYHTQQSIKPIVKEYIQGASANENYIIPRYDDSDLSLIGCNMNHFANKWQAGGGQMTSFRHGHGGDRFVPILTVTKQFVSKKCKNVVYDDRESQTFFTQKGAKFDSSTLMMLR